MEKKKQEKHGKGYAYDSNEYDEQCRLASPGALTHEPCDFAKLSKCGRFLMVKGCIVALADVVSIRRDAEKRSLQIILRNGQGIDCVATTLDVLDKIQGLL